MDHRFSLSMNSPRLSKPIADSTWIDGPSTSIRPTTTFQLSPKQRSNSSICLSASYVNDTPQNNSLQQTSRTASNLSRMTNQKFNLSQIDPKTYADVHSSGLASRIVKYHNETNGGLPRSMSFNNVHQVITQPRRNSIATAALGHRAAHLPSLSMTRIAPPERSFYCGNTLPSLLRSNSLLGVEKCSEQLSCENRPILHPQPLQHEHEPTRSVLEELKEISRKRINSGDIQQSEYNTTKKSCTRITDFVDHHNMPHHHSHPHPQSMSVLHAPAGVKRHRELSVAVPLRLQHAPIAVPLQHHHQQQLQMQQQQLHMTYGGNISNNNNHSPQQSPEQVAKRRNCSYSNDISSSLSSSKLYRNKRKLYDMREKFRIESASTTPSVARDSSTSSPDAASLSPSPTRQHVAKIQRRQPTSDLRLEHLTKTQSTPITPLPSTPAQRTTSAPIVQPSTKEDAATVASLRPKLTLFNAQQQQRHQQERTLDVESPDADVDAGEYAGIHFVKPKQHNSFNGVKNTNLERTQKTKLALMLSSLKGEIYQDNAELEPEPEARLLDEPDSKLQQTVTTATETFAVTTTTTTVPATTGTTTTTTTVAVTTLTTPAEAITATTAATTTTSAIVTATTKPVILGITSIVPALNSATTTSTAPTKNNSLNLISFNTTKPMATSTNTEASTTPNVPILSGFKLPTNTTNITFASPKVAETTPLNAAAPIMSVAATAPALTTTTASPGIFSFGNKINTTTTTMTANASSATVVTTAAITAPTFTFGKAEAVVATTAVETPAATTATVVPGASSMFTFGNAAATKATSLTAPTNTFSFGNSTSNIATPPAFKMDNWAPKPLESASGSNPTIGSALKSTMATVSAGAPTTAQNTVDSSNVFSFGKTTTNMSTANAVAPTATPIFGQASGTAAPTKAPSFSFNSATTTAAAPASTPSNNTTGIFSFAASPAAGGAPTVVKPVAKALPFSLSTSNKNSVFSFGAGVGGIAPKTPAETTAPSSFNFNATPAAPSAANTNNFSFNATPKQTPIFGSSSTETAAKPFTFGGNTATTEQQPQQPSAAVAAPQSQPQPPRAGGFSFAAVAQKSESTNLFATPAATSVVKPSFNFGGNSTPSIAPAGTTTQAPVAFGGFVAPAAPAAKPFAFGASATSASGSNAASPLGGNLFASALAATQQQSLAKPGNGFFSSTSNSNGGQSVAPVPANVNAPFSFGGVSSPPKMNNTSKAFTFGATSSSTPASNMFGSSAAAPTPSGAFNFGGAASPAAPGNGATPDMQGGNTAHQVNSGNVFALPNTPESRPIRRATRRLQK